MPQPRHATARLTLFGGPEVRGPGDEIRAAEPSGSCGRTTIPHGAGTASVRHSMSYEPGSASTP